MRYFQTSCLNLKMTPRKLQHLPSFSFSSTVKIRRIKEKLVTRNEDDVIEAVENMLDNIDNECFVQEVMKSDIPVLLTEATLPGNNEGNSIIYKCLRTFCNQRLFYSDGHALIVLHAACRTGMFLMNDKRGQPDEISEISELESVVLLLNDLLAGHDIFRVSVKNLTALPLKDFIVAVSSKLLISINTRYYVAMLLNTCLCNKSLKLLEESSGVFVENLVRYFNSLVTDAELEKMTPVMDQIVDITCCLAEHLSKCMESFDEKTRVLIEEAVIDFIVNHAMPHYVKISLNYFERQSIGLTAMFSAIDVQLDVSGQTLAHQLVKAKLLLLLPTIVCNAQKWDVQVLEKLAQKLLWRLLALVSLDVFKLPQIWPEGKEHFMQEVQSGVLDAPLDPSQWLQALQDSTTHRSVKLIVLLFLYFYVLTEGCLSGVFPLATIARFINDLNPVSPRAIFIKAIWLVLAVSEVNGIIAPDQDAVILKFSSLLESFADLDVVYTHHPTLLFHIMASTRFPTSLQYQVVRLWLIHQTENDKPVFSEFLKKSAPGKLVTLDLIQSGDSQVLEHAFEAAQELMNQSQDDEVSALVWKLLPIASAQMSGNAIRPKNFEKIAELALMRVPQSCDHYDLSRTVKLLSAAVSSMEKPPRAVWRLVHKLISLFIEKNDFYVVTCYAQSENFVEKLLDGFSSNYSEICLKIAAWLSNALRREDIPCSETGVKVPLSLNAVYQQLQSKDSGARHAALLFVLEVLEANWKPPLCRITDPPDLVTLRLLFSLLLSVAFLDKNDECFETLRAFFSFCCNINDDKVLKHFLKGYNLLYSIMNLLPYLPESKSMAEFLLFWCSIRQPVASNSRRLAVPLELTVIFQIGETILKSFRPFLMPLVLKLIEGRELVESEIHEKLIQLAETSFVEDLAESEPEHQLEEPVLDFLGFSSGKSSLEPTENLLESFRPPHLTSDENIVIATTQVAGSSAYIERTIKTEIRNSVFFDGSQGDIPNLRLFEASQNESFDGTRNSAFNLFKDVTLNQAVETVDLVSSDSETIVDSAPMPRYFLRDRNANNFPSNLRDSSYISSERNQSQLATHQSPDLFETQTAKLREKKGNVQKSSLTAIETLCKTAFEGI